ncbi:MAG: hypothetical protein ACI4GC_07815 [Acutalibacteraceae bacterium]
MCFYESDCHRFPFGAYAEYGYAALFDSSSKGKGGRSTSAIYNRRFSLSFNACSTNDSDIISSVTIYSAV